MASNPYVNKVVYDGTTLIDISDSTATVEDVANGKYFYTASGEKKTGNNTSKPDIFSNFFFGIGTSGYVGSSVWRKFDLGFTTTDAYVQLLYVYYGTCSIHISTDGTNWTQIIINTNPAQYNTKLHITQAFRYIGTQYDNAMFLGVIAKNPNGAMSWNDISYDWKTFTTAQTFLEVPSPSNEVYFQNFCHNVGTMAIGLSDGVTYISTVPFPAVNNAFPPYAPQRSLYLDTRYLRATSGYGVGAFGFIARNTVLDI